MTDVAVGTATTVLLADTLAVRQVRFVGFIAIQLLGTAFADTIFWIGSVTNVAGKVFIAYTGAVAVVAYIVRTAGTSAHRWTYPFTGILVADIVRTRSITIAIGGTLALPGLCVAFEWLFTHTAVLDWSIPVDPVSI